MLWAKLINRQNLVKISLIFVFLLAFSASRLLRLNNDIINPDGYNWHYRSQQFINGLKYGDLEKTYQHYHPGVTLMWLSTPVIELVRQQNGNNIYTSENFWQFDYAVKLALVVVQLVLTLFALYLLSKNIGFFKALLVCSLFSFEPFIIGNSRLYHLDMLETLILFSTLLLYYEYTKKYQFVYVVLTALFLAMAFLTKTNALILLSLILPLELFRFLFKNRDILTSRKELLRNILLLLFSFCGFIFLFWPVLWIKPVQYLTFLFNEDVRVGMRNGHDQYIFGNYDNTAPYWFYILVLLLKLSPVFLVSLILAKILFIKKTLVDLFSQKKNLFKNIYLNILQPSITSLFIWFSIIYLIIMSIPSKKIDRYIIIIVPYLAYIIVIGLYELYKNNIHKKVLMSVFILVFVISWVISYLNIYPYYFVYTNPLFGTGEQANTIIGQKPFGVGIYDLKEFILSKYQDSYKDTHTPELTLGFIDSKPMSAIYPNSLLFDIRVNSANKYDYIVLGPNEEISDNVLKSRYTFIKDSSMYINGLEYWRIYVKRFK